MRPVQRIVAISLFGLAFAAATATLFLVLGKATIDDPLCPGETFYSIWGTTNSCGHHAGWDAVYKGSDIMNFNGATVVVVAALSLAATGLALFRRVKEGFALAIIAAFAMIAVQAMYAIGLNDYTRSTGLGLSFVFGYAVFLTILPVLAIGCIFAFWATIPYPTPPRPIGQKPKFKIPTHTIRTRPGRQMRVLPDYVPKPREEEPEPEAELPADGQVHENPYWTTRIRSGMGSGNSSGKFRF